MQRFDVIVLGLGAMGSAATYHLARRGARVLGLEQFDIPHARGSSHGHSRMIRQAYFEHPDYVPLILRAYELWDSLEREAGHRLLQRTGGVYVGTPRGTLVSGSRASAEMHGLRHELLSRSDLARRFPQFCVGDDCVALFEPEAGYLLPERVVAAHVRLALELGARVHAHEPVLSWDADGDTVRVTSPSAVYHARRLIITPGAWASNIAAALGVTVTPTRQVLGWVWPKKPDLFTLGVMPVWAIESQTHGEHYGFPIDQDLPAPGFKVALHAPGAPTDPDRTHWHAQPGDEATFRLLLQQHLPDASGDLLAIRVCMYENSPDSHFIIDHCPGKPNVTIACGFSGHGFKFSSVVGEILADLALLGSTSLPIGFLRARRFA